MAINERARTLFNNACIWLQEAADSESVNEAIRLTSQGELAVKLAIFAVENHALVNGLDPDQALSQMTQYPVAGFPPGYAGSQPWGGAPQQGG